MVDFTHKLPAEVLAACFAFLEFDELISVSHVSRFWRSSALASPSLWTHILLLDSYGQPANLLHMAMSRAGQLAVNFDFFQFSGGVPENMPGAVAQYMHRFHTFEWDADPPTIDISRPAPLLRAFKVRETLKCVVPRNFLGGVACNLRTVHLGATSFPDACPALETVTYLNLSYPHSEDESPRFGRLFDLFPRLEILHLHYIDGSPGVELPVGPAPRTLREVKLQALLGSTDLFGVCTVWGLGSVADVQLTMPPPTWTEIAAFISCAEELSVLLEGVDNTQFVARLPSMCLRRLICNDFRGSWDPVAAVAGALRDPVALSQMKALELPLSMLNRALDGACHWPRLARLAVHIWTHGTHETHPLPEYYQRFCRPGLDCLRSVPAKLEALALHVHTTIASTTPTSIDECELVECLSELCGCLPREVVVYGFPGHVARTLALQDNRHHLVFVPAN